MIRYKILVMIQMALLAIPSAIFSQAESERIPFRFHLFAGPNLIEPTKFNDAKDIFTSYRPAMEYGIGIYYDNGGKYSILGRFSYLILGFKHGYDIQFPEGSYVRENFGFDRFYTNDPTLGDHSGRGLEGYEIGVQLERKLIDTDRHILSPSLGVSLATYFPFRVGLRHNIVKDDTRYTYYSYQYYHYNKYVQDLGIELGLNYRYLFEKKGAISVGLVLKLATQKSPIQGQWSIAGKGESLGTSESGTITVPLNRLSLRVGYIF